MERAKETGNGLVLQDCVVMAEGAIELPKILGWQCNTGVYRYIQRLGLGWGIIDSNAMCVCGGGGIKGGRRPARGDNTHTLNAALIMNDKSTVEPPYIEPWIDTMSFLI